MPKGVREITDAELLGDDDGVSQGAQDSLAEFGDLSADEGGDEGGDDKLDPNFEVVIADDEGELEDDADINAAGDEAARLALEDDDAGEVVDDQQGSDFLTDAERKNYSKAMRDRITRERRAKEDAEGRAISEASARRAAEVRALKAEKASVDLLDQNVAGLIATKTAELIAAKEGGDTTAEVKLSEELDGLRAKKREIVAAKERLEQTVIPETSAVMPATTAWLGQNRWFSHKDFAAQADYARAIDRTLAGDKQFLADKNITAGSPEYYRELNRRIHKEMPALQQRIKKTFGSEANDRQQQQRPANRVAPVNRQAAGVRSSGSRVRLSNADLANMANFGLNTDPKTKEGQRDLKAYAMQLRGGNNG